MGILYSEKRLLHILDSMDTNTNFRRLCILKNLPFEKCNLPENKGEICGFMPRRLIKTNQMRFKEVANLLVEMPKNLKVILFVRDPRGIIYSR